MNFLGKLIEYQRRKKEILDPSKKWSITKFIKLSDDTFICHYNTYIRFIKKPKKNLANVFLTKLGYLGDDLHYLPHYDSSFHAFLDAIEQGKMNALLHHIQTLKKQLQGSSYIYDHVLLDVLFYIENFYVHHQPLQHLDIELLLLGI